MWTEFFGLRQTPPGCAAAAALAKETAISAAAAPVMIFRM
jgi:hypothetical protein